MSFWLILILFLALPLLSWYVAYTASTAPAYRARFTFWRCAAAYAGYLAILLAGIGVAHYACDSRLIWVAALLGCLVKCVALPVKIDNYH